MMKKILFLATALFVAMACTESEVDEVKIVIPTISVVEAQQEGVYEATQFEVTVSNAVAFYYTYILEADAPALASEIEASAWTEVSVDADGKYTVDVADAAGDYIFYAYADSDTDAATESASGVVELDFTLEERPIEIPVISVVEIPHAEGAYEATMFEITVSNAVVYYFTYMLAADAPEDSADIDADAWVDMVIEEDGVYVLEISDYAGDYIFYAYADSDTDPETESISEVVEVEFTLTKYVPDEWTLDYISEYNIPDEDTWVLVDTTADEATDFAGLSAAIVALSDSGREISLEFPNLTSIPKYAMGGKNYGVSSSLASEALVSVSAPEATYIGDYAFGYSDNLRSVNFPKVTETGRYVFTYCASLTEVEFESLETLGDYTFNICKALTTAKLPEAVTLGKYIFSNCTGLVTASAPKATSAGFSCFYNCTSLTTVDLSSMVDLGTSDSGTIFSQCTSLESIELPSVDVVGHKAFYKCTALQSISLPKATEISTYAFNGCTSLASVDTPNLVTLGGAALAGTAIESYTIPSTLTTMDYNPFLGCPSLTSITNESSSFSYDSELGLLLNGDGSYVFSALVGLKKTELSLSDSVTTLGQYAFESYTTLETLSVSGLTTVETGALWRCEGLTKLVWSTLADTTLSSFATDALYCATNSTEKMDLYIGKSSSSTVSDNTITLGSQTLTFKSITVVEAE